MSHVMTFSPAFATPDNTKGVATVFYSKADRRNGWYCYLSDKEGNQLGSADYRYTKGEIKALAEEAAAVFGVKAVRL
jgi:hypothetical protein